jgi:hypothetical protein
MLQGRNIGALFVSLDFNLDLLPKNFFKEKIPLLFF